MIRPLEENDFDAAADIVNGNWVNTYTDYIRPALLDDAGCREREKELKNDFAARRLAEYVWEDDSRVLALLSIGQTDDCDKAGAFEVWCIYVAMDAQGRGIGRQLLAFAEQNAIENGYTEIVIWAFRENVRAVSFYQKQGWQAEK